MRSSRRLTFALFAVALTLFLGKFWLIQQHKHKPKTSSFPITENKSFVIVIPSYNNSKFVEKNLRSVFSQNYENFRVVYIDDNSTDDTLKQVSALLPKLDTKKRTTLIHNPTNQGALANIYNAVHSSSEHEIIVLLDGDDFLAHENVLNTLNQAYANPNTWLTYGNYLDYPMFTQEPLICKEIPKKVVKKRTFRKSPWMGTHLRTFYAALFNRISINDLFFRGRFYPMAWDLAMMLPMLEMAGNHYQFIPETLYLYNRENPISDHKINFAFQQACNDHIRARKAYLPLKQLPTTDTALKQAADALIFSDQRPLQLYALLESLEKYVIGLNKTTVLYRTGTPETEALYLELRLHFPKVQFIQEKNDFKKLTTKIAFEATLPQSDYILFATDCLLIKDILHLPIAIQALEKTKAFALYSSLHPKLDYCAQLNRHQAIPPYFRLQGLIAQEIPFAWQLSSGTDDWNTPCSLSFALYRKGDLKKIFNQLEFDSPETLAREWNLATSTEEVGLFYEQAKCIELEPKTSQNLLESFQAGLKIDLGPLFQLQAPSQRLEKQITLTEREN